MVKEIISSACRDGRHDDCNHKELPAVGVFGGTICPCACHENKSYKEQLIEIAKLLSYGSDIVDNESCHALVHAVKTLRDNSIRFFEMSQQSPLIKREVLVKKLEEYIEFLIEANQAPISNAHIHGWRCPQEDIDKGNRLRQEIKELKETCPAIKD